MTPKDFERAKELLRDPDPEDCERFTSWFGASLIALAEAPAIRLTPAEVQSGHDRVRWAQGLIEQLPADHDGRNSWLLNYGLGEEADALRAARRKGAPYPETASFAAEDDTPST
ncbi:hypothetical protein [Phenylobacterium sp.]|uniref:hypothetical protein n=1 Tax=Phenylobacterium sp. TaxID=1871053 RepID=UPI0026021F7B|nr:hypothetical protein [Phenylobacterium sp.]